MSRFSAYRETPPLGTGRPPKLVTLPPIALDDIDIEREAREVAERVTIRRVIREGLDFLATLHLNQLICAACGTKTSATSP